MRGPLSVSFPPACFITHGVRRLVADNSERLADESMIPGRSFQCAGRCLGRGGPGTQRRHSRRSVFRKLEWGTNELTRIATRNVVRGKRQGSRWRTPMVDSSRPFLLHGGCRRLEPYGYGNTGLGFPCPRFLFPPGSTPHFLEVNQHGFFGRIVRNVISSHCAVVIWAILLVRLTPRRPL